MKKFLNNSVFLILQFIFISIFLLVFIQTFTRYLFGYTVHWNIELCRYLYVWLTFLGAAFIKEERGHIQVTFFIDYLNKKIPPKIQKVIWVIKKLIIIVGLIVFSILGFIYAWKSRRFLSQAMQISQFFLYISISLGTAIYSVSEIQETIKEVKTHDSYYNN